MPKLKINGNDIEFTPGMTVLQACELAGAEIPRFCYHERLKIAGNCRMCLVQIEGGPPKPAASCAMPAAEGMIVHTDSDMVKKAREGVMEFLLMNHPLDCPICDQGGECDLQDQAMTYGRGESRFHEHKRAVIDKYMGPLVKTQMTRCIHCTRCIRFLDEVAGVNELGAIGRGEHMEVTTYVEKSLTSELSGNIIDLCPVGALTSKPYAYKARPWELSKTESIDVLDAVGSNIRIDSRGREVLRILPRLNEEINEEWISDKTRYAVDGLKIQRLDKPYIKKSGKLVAASWDEAIALAALKLKQAGSESAAIIGDLVDCESMVALKEFFTQLGSDKIDCRQDGVKISAKDRANYLFNTGIQNIENADVILLVGTNPRIEAPLINARLRKAYLKGAKISYIGHEINFNYKADNLGSDGKILSDILSGKHDFASQLKTAKNPAIIIGYDALILENGADLLNLALNIAKEYTMLRADWNGFNVLHRAASRVGALDLGMVPGAANYGVKEILSDTKSGKIKVLYLLGADEIDMSSIGADCFVIYQGHHGDNGAHRADVILPGSAYTEKNASYVNTEGRVQEAFAAVFAPGDAKEDWNIIKLLADASGCNFVYDSVASLRGRMVQIAPHFAVVGDLERPENVSENVIVTKPADVKVAEIGYSSGNFYMSDPISRASKTMALCLAENKKCDS